MHWYNVVVKLAGSTEEYLRNFGVSEDIINYISIQDQETANLLVNRVRQKPQMTPISFHYV